MTDANECTLCGEVGPEVGCWSVEGTAAWLCLGCVARGRAAGYEVVAWLPAGREAADAFRAGLEVQRGIEEEQRRWRL